MVLYFTGSNHREVCQFAALAFVLFDQARDIQTWADIDCTIACLWSKISLHHDLLVPVRGLS